MISRPLTVVFASLEALLVLAIGVVIPLLPLTILWAVQFSFGPDWVIFWRASVDVWLIGHGVDVTFTLEPALAARWGLAGEQAPFTVTVAALGFALLTSILGGRAGRRIAETGNRMLGVIAASVLFAGGSLAVTATALHPLAQPSVVQAGIFPTLFFVLGLTIGVLRSRRDSPQEQGRNFQGRNFLRALPEPVFSVAATALRGGAAAAALLVLISSLITAAAILLSYGKAITLYESLHTEVMGGVIVTFGQVAFLPTLVLWTMSWLIGPGFALGTGSLVSPLGTQLGPIPAIPVLGALPSGDLAFGFIGLLAPVLAGFFVGVVLGPGLHRRFGGPLAAAAAAGMGVTGGIILGLLAGFSSGALGPGRLAEVGPNPWLVGVWAAIELGIAALIGVFASGRLPTPRPR